MATIGTCHLDLTSIREAIDRIRGLKGGFNSFWTILKNLSEKGFNDVFDVFLGRSDVFYNSSGLLDALLGC
jgi:hypothetical protein